MLQVRELAGIYRANGAITGMNGNQPPSPRAEQKLMAAAAAELLIPVLTAHVAQTLQTHGSTACGDAGVLHSPASPFVKGYAVSAARERRAAISGTQARRSYF